MGEGFLADTCVCHFHHNKKGKLERIRSWDVLLHLLTAEVHPAQALIPGSTAVWLLFGAGCNRQGRPTNPQVSIQFTMMPCQPSGCCNHYDVVCR